MEEEKVCVSGIGANTNMEDKPVVNAAGEEEPRDKRTVSDIMHALISPRGGGGGSATSPPRMHTIASPRIEGSLQSPKSVLPASTASRYGPESSQEVGAVKERKMKFRELAIGVKAALALNRERTAAVVPVQDVYDEELEKMVYTTSTFSTASTTDINTHSRKSSRSNLHTPNQEGYTSKHKHIHLPPLETGHMGDQSSVRIREHSSMRLASGRSPSHESTHSSRKVSISEPLSSGATTPNTSGPNTPTSHVSARDEDSVSMGRDKNSAKIPLSPRFINAAKKVGREQVIQKNGTQRIVLGEMTDMSNEKAFMALNVLSAMRPIQTEENSLASDVAAEINMLTKVDDTEQKVAFDLLISGEGRIRMMFNYILVCLTLYAAIVTPLSVGFNVNTSLGMDIFLELVFVLDVIINFRTTYLDPDTREEITDKGKIAAHYMRTWFFPDLVSSVPLVTIITVIGGNIDGVKLFKLLRVFKLYQMGSVFNSLAKALEEQMSFNPAANRMLKFFVVFALIEHFMGCSFWYISRLTDFATSWSPDGDQYRHAPFKEQYAKATTYSLALTFGNDMSPTTTLENVFATICYLVALIVNAVIIGSAATLIANMDTTDTAKKRQMDGISEYMRCQKLPLRLQKSIRSFYEYLWDSAHTSHNAALLNELPGKLRLHLNVSLKKRLIESVPLFKTCSASGVIALVQNLKTHIILPDELVVQQGEKATCMFFIARGSVRVYTISGEDENKKENYIITLNEGGFFGEIALLSLQTTRTANVRSMTFCELEVLGVDDFLTVLRLFPSFKMAVEMLASGRMRSTEALTAASKAAGRFGMSSTGGKSGRTAKMSAGGSVGPSTNNTRRSTRGSTRGSGSTRRKSVPRFSFKLSTSSQHNTDDDVPKTVSTYDKVLEHQGELSHAHASDMGEHQGISNTMNIAGNTIRTAASLHEEFSSLREITEDSIEKEAGSPTSQLSAESQSTTNRRATTNRINTARIAEKRSSG